MLKTATRRAAASMAVVGLFAGGMLVSTGAGQAAQTAVRNVEILGDGVNIRNHPEVTASVVGTAYRGDAVYSYCQDSHTDGRVWLKVYNSTRGAEGWIRDDLARADGPLQRGNCNQSLAPRYS